MFSDSVTSAQLQVELARDLAASNHIRAATEAYLDLFEAGVHHPLVLGNLGASLFREGRIAEAIVAYRCAVARDPGLNIAWSNLLLALNCLDNIRPIDVAREHQRFGELYEPSTALTRPRRPGKLRLGFLSSCFFCHSGTRFFEPVLRSLDRGTFQIFCYQANGYEDETTRRLLLVTDKWRVISSLTDGQAIDQISADDLDLLVDLDGHTGQNRLAIFAVKPARVQLTWLGYPNTTGLRSIDFRITDSIADPAPFADQLHTEKLLRLQPPFLVFTPPEDSPGVVASPITQNGYITFGIFNQIHKLSDSAVAATSRILNQVADSRLLLKSTAFVDPGVCDTIAQKFNVHGIDRNRITCLGPTPNFKRHLESHHEVDIMLDTFPYNGTTTTCEGLWMGVPVVTLEGLTHQARVGSSLLQSVGLEELIGRTIDEYVSIAVALARDPIRLTALRNAMRPRMNRSPLMDLPGFVKRFEAALVYSARSVIAGSTRAARQAGIPHAIAETIPNNTITAA